MNDYENKVLKYILSGIFIFVFGIFIGYQLDNNGIKSIQGYLLNSLTNATDSNATDSNATDANATNSNAECFDCANASDDVIYLSDFYLKDTEVKSGDRLNLVVDTCGATIREIVVTFKDYSNDNIFNARVKAINTDPYIEVPYNIFSGEYTVNDVLLIANNSDGTTFSKHYSYDSEDDEYYWDFYYETVTITVPENKVHLINTFNIKSTNAMAGDKIYIDYSLYGSEKLKNLYLTFEEINSHDSFSTTVNSLDSSPYFYIPSNVKKGNYVLSEILALSAHNSIYEDIDKFSYSINVNGVNSNSLYYNLQDLDSKTISELYKNDTDIIVNEGIIKKDVFNAIKGKNKNLIIESNNNQMVFNGKDIKNAKEIDAEFESTNVKDFPNIENHVKNGVVLNFVNNGDLPGKATIRIKSTDTISSILENKKIYVYYYNEDSDNFCIIDSNIKLTKDGYYEFEITHNSNYLLVNYKLDSSLVVDNNVVTFQKSKLINIALILGGFLLAVIVIVVIIIIQKKNKKKKLNPEETNNEVKEEKNNTLN